MRASLATQIRPSPPSFSLLLHPPALEPSLPDLIFLFSTNYFSTPPGVSENKRTPSHFTRHQTPRTLIHRPTAFDAQAEPSRPREPGHELDQPIVDAASYPQSSESLPETCASSQE